MSDNLKKCINELQLVTKIKNKNAQKTILKQLARRNCFAKAVQEVAANTANANIPLKTKEKKKLKKHAHIIKALTKKKLSVKTREKLVSQSGGALGVLIPIVTSLISALLQG